MIHIRLWDVPVRVTHWLLVLLVLTSWVTAKQGSFTLHRLSGYSILAAVLFRVFWAFWGSTPARLASFLAGPAAVLKHARASLSGDAPSPTIGHSPLGGWNIVAMLGALLAQAGLGLFAVDVDGVDSGPLSALVSFGAGRRAAQLHEATFDVLLVLIALHVAAVLAYLLAKREDIISPMWHGSKRVPRAYAPAYRFPPARRAFLGAAIAVLLVLGLLLAPSFR